MITVWNSLRAASREKRSGKDDVEVGRSIARDRGSWSCSTPNIVWEDSVCFFIMKIFCKLFRDLSVVNGQF